MQITPLLHPYQCGFFRLLCQSPQGYGANSFWIVSRASSSHAHDNGILNTWETRGGWVHENPGDFGLIQGNPGVHAGDAEDGGRDPLYSMG